MDAGGVAPRGGAGGGGGWQGRWPRRRPSAGPRWGAVRAASAEPGERGTRDPAPPGPALPRRPRYRPRVSRWGGRAPPLGARAPRGVRASPAGAVPAAGHAARAGGVHVSPAGARHGRGVHALPRGARSSRVARLSPPCVGPCPRERGPGGSWAQSGGVHGPGGAALRACCGRGAGRAPARGVPAGGHPAAGQAGSLTEQMSLVPRVESPAGNAGGAGGGSPPPPQALAAPGSRRHPLLALLEASPAVRGRARAGQPALSSARSLPSAGSTVQPPPGLAAGHFSPGHKALARSLPGAAAGRPARLRSQLSGDTQPGASRDTPSGSGEPLPVTGTAGAALEAACGAVPGSPAGLSPRCVLGGAALPGSGSGDAQGSRGCLQSAGTFANSW